MKALHKFMNIMKNDNAQRQFVYYDYFIQLFNSIFVRKSSICRCDFNGAL